MAKRTAKKQTARKSAKKTTIRRATTPTSVWTSYKVRIISIFSVLVLALVLLSTQKHTISQSVAGASVFRPLYAQATVSWADVQGAASYNLYYKQAKEKNYTNAVRNIPSSIRNYTISYLKKNTSYVYRVSAKGVNGSEFWWSDEMPLTNISPM